MTARDIFSGAYSPRHVFNVYNYKQLVTTGSLTLVSQQTTQSYIRGHHVYKDIWRPFVGKTLFCQREEDNTTDPYSVAVKNEEW